jgi:hypothetical protein
VNRVDVYSSSQDAEVVDNEGVAFPAGWKPLKRFLVISQVFDHRAQATL